MSIPSRNSDPANIQGDERTFFVSSSTWGHRSLFQTERTCNLFIDVLYSYRKQGRYLLHEFVLMRTHFHVLLTVDAELSIERAVQLIKGGFSFRAKKELGITQEIWEKGFSDHRIRNEEEYFARKKYIHLNPVEAHLAQAPEEYAYSSAHPGYELDDPPQRLKPASLVASVRHA